MQPWASLPIAAQTLLRLAISDSRLAGAVQSYGVDLRWAGADNAPPPRSYTDEEQRVLIPQLAAVIVDLVERGLLIVRDSPGSFSAGSDVTVPDTELHAVLADPANWLWSCRPRRQFRLSVPHAVRECWFDDACPTADVSGFPRWDELSVDERRTLVCVAEASGMLTGPYGIWQDPPADLNGRQLLGWVDEQIAPLLPFVVTDWIEVRHFPDERETFTVIPARRLRTALADPAVRYGGSTGASEWAVCSPIPDWLSGGVAGVPPGERA